MSESDDSRIAALLMWTYNFFVHKVFCDDVIAHEELVSIVKNAEITRERGPEWSARIECFSILDQMDAVITFKLCGKLD